MCREGTVRVVGKLLVGSLFSNLTIGVDADDAVGTFDSRQTMRDADRCVVLGEQLAQSLVHQRL